MKNFESRCYNVLITNEQAMKKQNEHNACEAFITMLKALTGTKYMQSESPDEQNRETRDVDFLIVSNSDESDMIAIEHTILESYEGQIGYVNRSYDIVGSINKDCKNKIPDDRYYFLSIPPELSDSLVGKNRVLFVSNISSWVSEEAQKLSIDSQTQIEYEKKIITLMCCGSDVQLNGNVWRAPQSPDNQELMQTKRLIRSIEDKLPKLRDYKERGFTTALLLEAIAFIPSTITQRSHGMSSEIKNTIRRVVDYIIVFGSNEDRMIVGNVWKEKSIWHLSIPNDRRFSFRQNPGKGVTVET